MITLTNEMIINDIRNEVISNFLGTVYLWCIVILIAIMALVFIIIGICTKVKERKNTTIKDSNSTYNPQYTYTSKNKSIIRNIVIRGDDAFYSYNRFSIK